VSGAAASGSQAAAAAAMAQDHPTLIAKIACTARGGGAAGTPPTSPRRRAGAGRVAGPRGAWIGGEEGLTMRARTPHSAPPPCLQASLPLRSPVAAAADHR